jgi:translation initiation factor IF-3
MKQMKFAYGIGTNDLLLKIKKIKELLSEWYTMRVFVQLKWRENIYKDKIIEKFMFIQESLSDCAKSQTPLPKQDKNTYSFVFTSISKK